MYIDIFAFGYSIVCNIDCLVENVYQNHPLHTVTINCMCKFIGDCSTGSYALHNEFLCTQMRAPARYLPSNSIKAGR